MTMRELPTLRAAGACHNASPHISTYSDGYGGTTGTIGNKRISTYGDGYGYTSGTIGRDQVNAYTDRSGFTTGTIGRGARELLY